MSFGLKLRKILKEKNMTQTDLAELLKCKQAMISRWVKGRSNNPKMETLEKLSKVFDVPVAYFIADNRSKTEQNIKNKQTEKNNNSINENLMMSLIEKQNKITEEINKKFETEISLIKKEIELLKIKINKKFI